MEHILCYYFLCSYMSPCGRSTPTTRGNGSRLVASASAPADTNTDTNTNQPAWAQGMVLKKSPGKSMEVGVNKMGLLVWCSMVAIFNHVPMCCVRY